MSTTSEWRKKNPEKAAAQLKKQIAVEKERYRSDPEYRSKRSAYHRKRKYGISQEEYNELVKSHKNKCAGCFAEFSLENPCHVDHNHTTNKVRGLVCVRCNLTIGNAMDSPEILQTLANYLIYYDRNPE